MSKPEATIPVLCFGPGISPAGIRSNVRVQGSTLILAIENEAEQIIPTSQINVTSGGFDHQQLILNWASEAGLWSAMPVDQEAQRLLLAAAPETLAPQLSKWQRQTKRTHRGFKIGSAVLALIIALPLLLLLTFFWQLDRITAWAVSHISLDMEQQLGDLAFKQTKAGLQIIDSGPAVDAVRDIGQRLTKDSKYKYQWYVANNRAVNAFAMPGGYVVVFTGLLNAADSAEEVAGVLAHEVQHIEQRHSLKGLVHSLGWQAVVSVALGDVSSGVWGNMASKLGSLNFSRNQETEADLQGLQALRKAHIDPSGMTIFFKKMAQQAGDTPIELLSTHPASTTRFTTIDQALQDLGPWPIQPLPYNWQNIKTSIR